MVCVDILCLHRNREITLSWKSYRFCETVTNLELQRLYLFSWGDSSVLVKSTSLGKNGIYVSKDIEIKKEIWNDVLDLQYQNVKLWNGFIKYYTEFVWKLAHSSANRFSNWMFKKLFEKYCVK